MYGFLAIYFRELMILRRRLTRQIPSWSVSPLLYLLAFGYAVGRHVEVNGHSYLEFLIPGLVAMSSMTQAFAISSEINISRFYWHIFEEFQAAPVSNISYVLGEVLAGMTRAFLSVCVILAIGLAFGVFLSLSLWFWAAVLLNSFVFASLAVGLAMMVKSHADQSLLNSFIITPMAFLGGTVFPLDRLPLWAQQALNLLPLTHASSAIRKVAFDDTPPVHSYLVLCCMGIAFFFFAVIVVNKAKD